MCTREVLREVWRERESTRCEVCPLYCIRTYSRSTKARLEKASEGRELALTHSRPSIALSVHELHRLPNHSLVLHVNCQIKLEIRIRIRIVK